MLHEEVNRESMQLAAKIGKVTYEEIKKALEKLIAELKTDIHKAQHPDPTHGKQSLKELAAQNAGLSSIELTDPNLRQLSMTLHRQPLINVFLRQSGLRQHLFLKVFSI